MTEDELMTALRTSGDPTDGALVDAFTALRRSVDVRTPRPSTALSAFLADPPRPGLDETRVPHRAASPTKGRHPMLDWFSVLIANLAKLGLATKVVAGGSAIALAGTAGVGAVQVLGPEAPASTVVTVPGVVTGSDALPTLPSTDPTPGQEPAPEPILGTDPIVVPPPVDVVEPPAVPEPTVDHEDSDEGESDEGESDDGESHEDGSHEDDSDEDDSDEDDSATHEDHSDEGESDEGESDEQDSDEGSSGHGGSGADSGSDGSDDDDSDAPESDD